LLLSASVTEGASRVLLEGMAAALPILSTAVGNAPEILEGRMLLNSWDTSAWARKISDVVSDSELLTATSLHNYTRALDFHISKVEPARRSFFSRAIEENWCLKVPETG